MAAGKQDTSMANISLTTACNRSCAYCFARISPARRDMRAADFRRVLDLLRRSGTAEARFVGGEPTLHPEFPSFAAEAAGQGFFVRVFSNGLMPEAALAVLASLPADRCGVLVNVPCPAQADATAPWLARTLQALGPRAGVGVNIYRPALPLGAVLELVDRHGLSRHVRLGLAQPCLGSDNAFLAPRHYAAVGRDIVELARLARTRGVRLSFDCGFVPCMFPPELWDLVEGAEKEVGMQCGPIPDILPDLSAIHCYALAGWEQRPISGADTIGEITAAYRDRFASARSMGVFRACGACPWRKQDRCNGGCLAAALRHCRGLEEDPALATAPPRRPAAQAGPAVRVKAAAPTDSSADRHDDPSSARQWVLPYIDQPAEFWMQLAQRYPGRIAEVYLPMPGGRVPTGRPEQPHRHVEAFLRQGVLRVSVLINPIVLPAPADQGYGRLVDRLSELADTYGVASATVSDLRLAERIRARLPRLQLTASTLMNVREPQQALLLNGVFDALVPGPGLIRNLGQLRQIRQAFSGRLRLLVNEGCLPGCLLRCQHFFEMAYHRQAPDSLCAPLLSRDPWLRLTGAWVLPQHLDLLDPLADEYKLAGRVTLRDPTVYLRVCDAYLYRTALWPDEIGGGPASVLERLPLSQGLARHLSNCGLQCHDCSICRRAIAGASPSRADASPAATESVRG